jgi:PAS domain S-box-containing protein
MADALRASIEQLKQEQHQTQMILHSTADGVLTVAEDGTVLSMNAAAERLFGYTADEVVDQNFTKLISTTAEPQPRPEAGEAVRFGRLVVRRGETEIEGQHQDGHQVPLALRLTETTYLGHHIFIATVQDIAERKRAERERGRVFTAIRDAAERLSLASNAILATTERHAASAQQQAAQVAETLTTLHEIATTAQQSVERAEGVADSARHADEVSQAGRVAIDSTMSAMQAVREKAELTAQNILSLAEQAQAIGDIITSVSDIADRTNVLALNAAVEAARAGEQGKGFSVVAAEVKGLAEQSKKATAQVRHLLGDIRQATNAAVLSTEQGTRSVREAGEVVRQAENTIVSLAETISAASQAVMQIVATSSQQAVGVQQITRAMSEIDGAVQHTLSASQESRQLAHDLNQLANGLQELLQSDSQRT